MKPETITNTNFQAIPVANNRDGLKSQPFESAFSYQDFTVPEPMSQQEVEPPAYIWDRIATVLDAQDRLKAAIHTEPTDTSAPAKINNNRMLILYAAIVMLIGAIILSVI